MTLEMTTDARYRNHQHYIDKGWSAEPKQTFVKARAIVERTHAWENLDVLDVGCATGELLGYLQGSAASCRFAGVDVTDSLLDTARHLLPEAEFVNASALALPPAWCARFDVVLAIGCMSIFDHDELSTFWQQLLGAARPGGVVVVLSPLNEFGVDAVITHRKRSSGAAGPWERGWNVFSLDTVRETLQALGQEVGFERFELPFDLEPQQDPIRTWTIRTESRERQLTNGLKLLVDHYFVRVEKGQCASCNSVTE